MPHALLALGANLGDPLSSLEQAVAGLATLGPVRRSSWYETEPVGMPGAPPFLNGAVSLDTSLNPIELLDVTRGIEARLGRDQKNRSGSRMIDIDILFYGYEVVSLPGLEIPHPRLADRAFVLVPLAEIEPEFRHPALGATVAELLQRVGHGGVRRAA